LKVGHSRRDLDLFTERLLHNHSGCDVLIFRVGDISKGMEEGDSNSSREVVLDI
jgi:hypothetical protein